MTASLEELRSHLQAFDFPRLFIEGLGWDHYNAEPLVIQIDDSEFELTPVAEKSGFAVFCCAPDQEGAVPSNPIRRKLERQVAKRVFEHLLIFTDKGQTTQKWQWVKREAGKSESFRVFDYFEGQSGDHFLHRLQSLFVSLDEEASLSIAVIAARVRMALDVERVTKEFYERFRDELTAFGERIHGIPKGSERDLYASLMLNRMMFLYFFQKQQFLDGDSDYLRNQMRRLQFQNGGRRKRLFYRAFLLTLFHEGLGKPEGQRAPDIGILLGKTPFLNGGMFDIHDIELEHPQIEIPDEAFERLFDFFDNYRWHLDERPNREDNEINPDVLGYIFEKYVNQKQMGAYYTKEDVTGYIARNTVVPILFRTAEAKCPIAFTKDGGVWRLLKDDPDRYIYPSLGHGVTWDAQETKNPNPCDKPIPLPIEISDGVDAISKRALWDHLGSSNVSLENETWRETISRRNHHRWVRELIASGDVKEIDELISLNLDIERFASDVILQSEGPELLRAFWHALREVSVLDPTCGSGAFLFAALNTLEPLYNACLEGMRGFLYDLTHSSRPQSQSALSDFRRVLSQVEEHPSERYFVLKSIVLNNLHGVDIMEEATEICKLRLFLKLVAQLQTPDQIEPLPDIDFNIRPGNALVGFESLEALRNAITMNPDGQHRQIFPEEKTAIDLIEEEAESAGAAFNRFRWQQTIYNGQVPANEKNHLRRQFQSLRSKLDRYTALSRGIDISDQAAYNQWSRTHKPFHWFVEFHEVMKRGGFDVIIGNPPYLEFKDVPYKLTGYSCLQSRAIHATCIERGVRTLRNTGSISMVVPLSLTSTQRMKSVQDTLEIDSRSVWYANFAWRPGKLFDAVNRAITIFIAVPSADSKTFSTNYQKWASNSRSKLFELIQYAQVPRSRTSYWVPKIGTEVEFPLLEKLRSVQTTIAHFMAKSDHRVFYRKTGGLYWKVFTDFPPAFSVNGKAANSSRQASFSIQHSSQIKPIIAVLSSNIYWWWYTLTSNLRDLNPIDIRSFPTPKAIFDDHHLKLLADRYIEDIVANSETLIRRQKNTGITATQLFKIQKSKPIIDDIDRSLSKHYGLSEDELDFIVTYDLKFRLGAKK